MNNISNTESVRERLLELPKCAELVRYILKRIKVTAKDLQKVGNLQPEQSRDLISFLVRKEMLVRNGTRKTESTYGKDMEFYGLLREIESVLPPVVILPTRDSERKKVIISKASEMSDDVSKMLQLSCCNIEQIKAVFKLLPDNKFLVKRLFGKKAIFWQDLSESCYILEKDARQIISFLVRNEMLERKQNISRNQLYVKTRVFVKLLDELKQELLVESEY